MPLSQLSESCSTLICLKPRLLPRAANTSTSSLLFCGFEDVASHQLCRHWVRSAVSSIPLYVRKQFFDHSDGNESEKDGGYELRLVGGYRWEELQAHLKEVEAVDHFRELQKQTHWHKVPPGVAISFNLVAWVLSVPMFMAAISLIILMCCLFIFIIIPAWVNSYSRVLRPSASSLDLFQVAMILPVLKEVNLLEQLPREQIWHNAPSSWTILVRLTFPSLTTA